MRFQKTFAPVVSTLAFLLLGLPALAEEPSADPQTPSADTKPAAAPASTAPATERSVLGILPNYRIVQETDTYAPISAGRKFYIGFRDATSFSVLVRAAAVAGLGQATDSHPRYGQGGEGFGKRFGAAVADQVSSSLLTEAVLPALFRQDPRYFRLGKERGSTGHRLGYAMTRILVTKTDRGNLAFNFSEVIGNAGSAALGNLYYTGEKKFGDTAVRFGSVMLFDALSAVLREFWPDIRRKVFRK
ncbi:MAG TPA: hypothetical protein VGP79_17080 [Bryobacteraceae bacterium]|jgi:hypothetical protein|nr:hypothetical protein [Bryobacteraceae bacterium]